MHAGRRAPTRRVAAPAAPSRPLLLLALLALAAAPAAANYYALQAERTRYFDPQWCPNTIARQAIKPRMASDCKHILIPPTLCTACKLRPHDDKGVFPPGTHLAQRDIYDTSAPACRAALEKYRDRNPCDWPRVRDINRFYRAGPGKWVSAWEHKQAKQDLGEFMYNVCELCCDCIPIGLNHDTKKMPLAKQYDARLANEKSGKWGQNGLLNLLRGNCPVHYYYDTCRMWPNITDIGNWWSQITPGQDQICGDHVYPWWNDPRKFYKNWPTAKYVPIPSKRFRDFLNKIAWVIRCRDKSAWIDCANMEMAQKRV